MRLNLRPYNFFLPVVVVLLIASFFMPQHKTLDIHLWDTYYILTLRSVCWMAVLFLALFWILYRLTGPVLFSLYLTCIHVIFTVAVLAVLLVAPLISDSIFNPKPAHFISQAYPKLFEPGRIITKLGVLLGVFFLCQLVYLANLFLGILKKFF